MTLQAGSIVSLPTVSGPCGHVLVASALFIALGGCGGNTGPELAPVSGRVTLDGAPLKGAQIMFQPETTGGSPSYGATDQEGRYELGFKRGVHGALPGWHTVRIDEPTGADGKKLAGKRLPARYNDQTELREEVKSGEDNTIDFELQSSPK